MPVITSRQHPFVRQCRQVAQGRGAADAILVEGPHLVAEAIGAGVPLSGLLTDGRHAPIEAEAARRGVPVLTGAADVLASASPVQHGTGLVAIGRWQPCGPPS